MSSGRAKYLASILNRCGGRLAFERKERECGREYIRQQRAKKFGGEIKKVKRKKRLTLTRMDLRGTKAQFYRITFNKFYSRIMLSISKKKTGINAERAISFPRSSDALSSAALIIEYIIISNKLPAVLFDKLCLVNDDNSFCVLHREIFS